MSVRRFGLFTVGLAATAAAAGVVIGVLIGRSGTSELALTASWGGFVLMLFAAFSFAGDATPAFPGMFSDRGMVPDRAARRPFAIRDEYMLSMDDVERAQQENLSRFERVAGPGLIFACAGLLAIALSLAVYRVA